MNASFHHYLCGNHHQWLKLAAADSQPDPGVCPVCKNSPTSEARLSIVDRPIFRFVSSATHRQQNNQVQGDGLYYVILESPDLKESYCCRYPLTWDAAVRVAHSLQDLTFSKAKRLFLRLSDKAAGIHENLRAALM